MKYSHAMALMSTKRIALRTSAPENRIAYRFGDYVLLNGDPEARPAWISWTPTEEDLKAEDWKVLEPDGTLVPRDRLAPGADREDDPPLSARGGRGTGTGWRRA